MGSGSKFSDPTNPAVVVKAGESGSSGVLEITDMVFKTKGPCTPYHPDIIHFELIIID
jgi:glucan 1,3-beta-glucosidase